MAFDVEGARKEGYSDADIAGYLAKQRKFDLAGARKEGYSDADVIAHLSKAAPKFTPREATPADIPGAVAQPTYQEPSMTDRLLGLPETAATIISGGASGLAGQVAGIFGGKLGQGPNVKLAEKIMQAGTYRPTGEGAQANLQSLGAVGSALPGFIPAVGQAGQIAQSANVLAARATPAINALRNEAQMVREFQPFPERAARLQQERITQSFQNAPQIEAAQAAQRIGVAIPPSVSNPTKGNKIVAALTGSPEAKMARSNELQWTEAAKKDMGLTPNTTLNQQGFESAKSNPNIVKPYDTVRKLGLMVADEADLKDIQNLQKQAFIGGKSSADAVASFIDDAIQRVSAGMTGEELLREVQNIRQRANEIYTAQRKGVEAPSPESIAVAKASDALANKLEDIAATNLTGTEARAFQNARTSLAKIYDYERATDVRTGRLDPIKFAKITEGKQTSGTAADIANVAANFPSIAEVKPGAWTQYIPPLARGGTGGALGFGLGSLVGFPAAGGVIGATGGAFANALMAKRMSSPAYQAANAMPPDYRPPVNMMRPATPGSSNLAIFNPQSAVLPPEYTPNFTMPGQGQPQPRPDLQPAGVPPQLPAPGMEGVAQARGYEYARDRAAAEAAAAQSAGPRQPAAGGMLYELDPFTGKLRPAGEQVKGTETFAPREQVSTTRRVQQLKDDLWGLINESEPGQSNKEILDLAKKIYTLNLPETAFTPPSGLQNITKPTSPNVLTGYQTTLESAIAKAKRGEMATLSAEEKVALKGLSNPSTRTGLDIVYPTNFYGKLSPVEIFERMTDRQWVADTIQKAKEQIKGFEEIAARKASRDADIKAQRDAITKRDQLFDLLETLESKYAQPRPTPSPQGPKTRAAKRNALAPENQNNLAP